MIKGIKFVSVPVRDQDRPLEFWTATVGLQVATDQPFDGAQRWIELRFPGTPARLVLFTMPAHADRIGTPSNITFLADDVIETSRQLAARGVEFTQPPRKHPWGTMAVFRDPDGNTFVLSSR